MAADPENTATHARLEAAGYISHARDVLRTTDPVLAAALEAIAVALETPLSPPLTGE